MQLKKKKKIILCMRDNKTVYIQQAAVRIALQYFNKYAEILIS